ncbi:MAG: PASTA domain-containing protein [Cytophagaceae bacterium]|nr:PASTA domain-containing protein [Cytophagaceae bacterium]
MAWLKAESKKDILVHLAIIVAIFLLLILLFFYVYLPVTTNHGELIKVPDLKGKSLSEIETTLDDAGLRYKINDSSYVAGAKPLTVISQNPLPNAEVKSNRQIYVTITATTPPKVGMPNLVDKSLKAAELDLRSRDLVLAGINQVPSPFANLVINQYAEGKKIEPGTMIAKGTRITLDVGDGIETKPVPIPNLVGLPLDDARALLSSMGLREGDITKQSASGKEFGVVLKQKPEFKDGLKISTGDKVDLWVAE